MGKQPLARPGPIRLLAGVRQAEELGGWSGPPPPGAAPISACQHLPQVHPPLCPHHEVGARAPHHHQLQLQLLGYQSDALAEGGDLQPVAGVGQADGPAGGSGQQLPSALAIPSAPDSPPPQPRPWSLTDPTSLMEMAPCSTVTTEAPSSTMTRERSPLGPRRSWTLKVGEEVSLQMAANM